MRFTEEHRRNISESRQGMTFSDGHRRNLSIAHTGHKRTPEAIEKTASFHRGRTRSKETCERISKALKGRKRESPSEETRHKMSESGKGRLFTEEHKRKISESLMGKQGLSGSKNPRWLGGISFEPYCPRFNNQLKERIRNRDGRTCVLCGTGEIQNGQRLSVHHIDGDKMQGCVGQGWYLCALCISCNSRPDTVEKEFLIVSNLHHLEMMK